ncbi:putative virulence factor, partial [Candidatus Woesearchaeota archaeon]|nr:putative virulence factor [Candidatus Woesearchaeota archaeon]
MEQKIIKQLSSIDKSLKWIKETVSMQGAKGELAYQNLVNLRRKLNKKKYALSGNPAAAIYGESQVGKSYLISSLLSEVGSTFEIIGQNDKKHNFIEEINPPGGGSESTSLVSRFSVSYKPLNKEFPIEAVLLSLADIILVLCDSFYNDLKASHDLILKADEINTYIENVKEKLKSIDVQQLYLKEDDVLDLKDYFINHLSKAGEVLSSKFFAEIPLLISKLPPEQWKDIFSLLWNRNDKFTSLFSEIILEYGKIKFAESVYLPVEAVLVKHGTLLDVERLKEIYGKPKHILPEYKANTKVLIIVNGIEDTIELKKSYLCAFVAELVFSQPVSLIKNKPFLKETDLLDFPGARSRLTLPEKNIETEKIPELLLRGKVAYLFHKYSEYEKINILLFCAKHDQPAQR